MPDRDGFITAAESQALEKQAEELLKQDARDTGFIRANGRGFSEYMRTGGMTTKKILETVYKHEVVGWDPLGLNPPRADLTGAAVQPDLATDKEFNRPGKETHTKGIWGRLENHAAAELAERRRH